MYGRRGDPSVEEGEGIAVCKVVQGCRTLFCLITYVYPTLSARAVPQLKEFCETQRELLASVIQYDGGNVGVEYPRSVFCVSVVVRLG